MLWEGLEHRALLPRASPAQKQMKHMGAQNLGLGARKKILALISKDGNLNK